MLGGTACHSTPFLGLLVLRTDPLGPLDVPDVVLAAPRAVQWIFVALSVGSACERPVERQERQVLLVPSSSATPLRHENEPERPRSGWAVGCWSFEQPWHAGYEASLYMLKADGTLRHVQSVDAHRPSGNANSVGRVAKSEQSHCLFANRWRELGAQRIAIAASCDDRRERWIEFEFGNDDQLNYLGVSGESGWYHDGWEWRIHRCANRDACDAGRDLTIPVRCDFPL